MSDTTRRNRPWANRRATERPTLGVLTLGVLALVPLLAGAEPPAPVRLLHAEHALAGRIWSTRERRFVDDAAVLARFAEARFLLLGERHGNPEHHRLQGRLIAAAAEQGRRVAVVAEQLDFPVQAAIDACARECTDFGHELGERVGWARSGWPAYALYAPVFAAADAADAAVYAGNPGARRIRALAGGAAPAAEEAAWAARAKAPLDAAGRERLVEDLVAGHCGHLPAERTPAMIHAQRLRDAAMAATLGRAGGGLASVVDGNTPNADAGAGGDVEAGAASEVEAGAGEPLAVLVAGNGHARRDYGVPTLLGDAAALVIGFVEVVPGRDDPVTYGPADAFDFLWFTPRVDEPDPCEQFREQLERLRKPAAGGVSVPPAPR